MLIHDLLLVISYLPTSGLKTNFQLFRLPPRIIIRVLLGIDMFDMDFEAVVALRQCMLEGVNVRLQFDDRRL